MCFSRLSSRGHVGCRCCQVIEIYQKQTLGGQLQRVLTLVFLGPHHMFFPHRLLLEKARNKVLEIRKGVDPGTMAILSNISCKGTTSAC